MLARHVAFLTEETAIRMKNNIVQLVLTSNISRNTLDHTSAAPEQVYGAHQAFMNKQGCPDNFWGQNFQSPQRKGIRFLFLSWFDPPPPLVWAPWQMSLLPPPSLNGPVNKSIGHAPQAFARGQLATAKHLMETRLYLQKMCF